MNTRYHKQTAEKALRMIYPQLSEKLMKRIVHADVMADAWSFLRYRRELHFDRIPFASHESAWEASILALKYHIMLYRWHMSCGEEKKGCRELGYVMHIVQDFFSHSNVQDLAPQQQSYCIDQLVALSEKPEPVRITSFSAMNVFGCGLDAFSHKHCSSDRPSRQLLSLTARALALFLKKYPLPALQHS